MKESNKAILYASIAVLSWSTVATMFKIALSYFSHYEMLVIASITALLFFALILTFQKKWGEIRNLSSGRWLWFAGIGLLNPVAYYLVLFKSYALLPAQIAQPINYFWPIILLVLLALFAKQPIAKHKYIGMGISLAGVTLISLGSGNISGNSLPVSGLLLALLSAFLWATYWIANRQNQQVDANVALFLSFLFGTAYLLAGTLFVEVSLNSTPGLLASIYVGLFEVGIPFVFFGLAIRKSTNPALINQMCYLAPFISLFLIAVVLGETIYMTTYIGLFLIVAGILFNESKLFAKRK